MYGWIYCRVNFKLFLGDFQTKHEIIFAKIGCKKSHSRLNLTHKDLYKARLPLLFDCKTYECVKEIIYSKIDIVGKYIPLIEVDKI